MVSDAVSRDHVSRDGHWEGLPDKPTVSVIIAMYNQEEIVADLFAALAKQTWDGPLEILAADNGSVDATVAVAQRFARQMPALQVIRADRAQGQCAARNDAVRRARGDLLLFVDGDDVPADDWIEKMVGAALCSDLVGGRLDVYRLNSPSAVARWPGLEASCLPTFDFMPCSYATGTNFGIWRRVFDDVGPWNETYRGGGEDAEFCWRAQAKGYALKAAPDAVVHYRLRTTLRAQLRQNYGYGLAVARLRQDFSDMTRRQPLSPIVVRRSRTLLLGLLSLFGESDRRARFLASLAFRYGAARGAWVLASPTSVRSRRRAAAASGRGLPSE
jgi:glycosyltransferase involved in cell wall biosynthesis